jgi:hypothetical protein
MPLSLRPVMNYGWNMGFQCWTALQPLSLAKTAGHFVNNTPAHNYIAASRGDCIRRCFVFFTPDACSFMKTRCQTLQLYQNTLSDPAAEKHRFSSSVQFGLRNPSTHRNTQKKTKYGRRQNWSKLCPSILNRGSYFFNVCTISCQPIFITWFL